MPRETVQSTLNFPKNLQAPSPGFLPIQFSLAFSSITEWEWEISLPFILMKRLVAQWWTGQCKPRLNHIRAKQLNTGRGKVGYNESQHNLPFRVRLGLKSLKGIFRAGIGKLFGKGQDSKYFSLAAWTVSIAASPVLNSAFEAWKHTVCKIMGRALPWWNLTELQGWSSNGWCSCELFKGSEVLLLVIDVYVLWTNAGLDSFF